MRLHRPLARVRRRLRLQAALEGGALAAVVAATLLVVGVYLWRLHVFGGRGLVAVGLAAAGLVARRRAGAGRGAHSARARGAGKSISRTVSTIGVRSALAFGAEPEPTPFMVAAMADAEAGAERVDAAPRGAVVAPGGAGDGGGSSSTVAGRGGAAAFSGARSQQAAPAAAAAARRRSRPARARRAGGARARSAAKLDGDRMPASWPTSSTSC